ncbi:MAG: ferric reductase-like transmembrane domain-containing protein [Candidatus Saccharimonas aalborgensis]
MQPSGKRTVVISFRWEHLLGWGITILLCIIPVVLWHNAHPLSYIKRPEQVMLALGQVTGLIGTVMYALNLLYATRLRFLEYLFGGLNRVYIAHHLLGGLALIMLSFHPLMLALRFVSTDIKQAALLLVPNGIFPLQALFDDGHIFHQSVLQQWAIFFGIIAFWGMVALLLITFFIKLPYRLWLFTHRFLGVAFAISALHILFISSDVAKLPGLRWYMLAIVIIGTAAFVYKSLLGRILIRRYRYIVRDVTVVAGNVVQIKLEPVGQPISYKPGQFVFMRFIGAGSGISKEWHPFSISSNPKDSALEISIKGLGDYTNKLTALKAGTHADIEGAYGRFSYVNYKNTQQIWIAGGIGITPFLSMSKDIVGSDAHADLYYSVKTESELINWDMLSEQAVGAPHNLRIIPFIGDKQPSYLSVDFIAENSGGLEGKDFYICGPPPMMQSLKKQLRARGVPATSIHSEEFGMS